MYETLKILHLFSMIAWMAVLLYLPRLFVYHAEAKVGSEHSEVLKIMERRLLRGIGTPAMIATIVFGFWLVISFTGFKGNGWLHAKIALVFLLVVYHFILASMRKAFADDRNARSATFYRWFNELPALILLGILVLVVAQPF